MSETPDDRASYGRQAFDLFIQKHWDLAAAEDSQKQWERLVWEWQEMTLLERWPYQQPAEFSSPEINEKIRHVLATHQTAHERRVGIYDTMGIQTVWLRTCYDPNLASKYAKLKRSSEVPGWAIDENKILDDPALYDFDDGTEGSWRRVLVRVPGLTDFRGVIDMDGDGSNLQYPSGQNDEWMIAQAESEKEWRELALAELRIQVGLYLIDREAIETGLLKMLWLDEHGEIAWENRLDPMSSDLESVAGALLGATSLVELTGYNDTRKALIIR